jgi:hypothetical protein
MKIAFMLIVLLQGLAGVVYAQPNNPTLFIIGDSTVKTPTAGQQGWGDPIAELFDQKRIRVENRARGGRSSRTFQTEGLWDQVLTELKPGDFVLRQGYALPGCCRELGFAPPHIRRLSRC